MATVTIISLRDNPELEMKKVLEVYNKLKGLFCGSEHLVVTSAILLKM
nr:DUF4003 domain-containing protein [Miniphocaeibacter massiliensis]